ALRQRGIGREDRIGIVAPISPEVAIMSMGVIAAATAVHLPPAMPRQGLDAVIRRLGLRAIAAPAGLADSSRDAAARAGLPFLEFRREGPAGQFRIDGPAAGPATPGRPALPEDLATIALSSGTTGMPKLIPRAHRNVTGMAARASRALPLAPGNRSCVLMPYFHHGWVQAIRSVETGGFLSLPGEFDSRALPVWLAAHRPDWLFLNPSMLAGLVQSLPGDAPPAGGALRFVQVAGISLPPPVRAAAAAALGARILDCYGSNEAGTVALETPDDPAPPGAVGRITVPVRIVTDAGLPLPAGETGLIEVPASEVTPGYLDDPLATARAFTDDGWFRMGDLGRLSPDGWLSITGRADEVINRGGEKIDPYEVEAVLLAHPAVLECAVFPAPHPVAGQEPAAAIVLRPGALASGRDLRRWALDRLAPGMVPRRVLFLPSLPRTHSGKIQRHALPNLLDRGSDS
ncbi:MAG: class I adenylate-forming enzyme family protein, partial [Chloroflexota bacterium]